MLLNAKLIGGGNLAVEWGPQGSTFSTNGSVIRSPALPAVLEPRDERKFLGAFCHEGLHVQMTDFGIPAINPLHRRVRNILEDGRIEYQGRVERPGIRRVLEEAMDALFDDGYFVGKVSEDPGINVLNAVLFYVRAQLLGQKRFKPGFVAMKAAADAAFPGLMAQLEPVIDQCLDAPSTSVCHDLAVHVLEIIQEYCDQLPETGSDDSDENSSSATGGEDSDGSDDSDENSSSATGGEDSDGSGRGSAREDLRGLLHADDDALPDTDIGDIAGQAVEEMSAAADPSEVAEYASVGKSPYGARVTPIDERAAQNAAAVMMGPLRNRLEAESRTRSTVRTSGRNLFSRHLHRVGVDDPRIFRRKARGKSLDTCVGLLVDVSGSMVGQQSRIAMESAYALNVALAGLRQVKVETYLFDDHFEVLKRSQENFAAVSGGFLNGIARGGTCLDESLLTAASFLQVTRSSRHILIVMTDGQVGDTAATRAKVDLLESQGLEVYGIGIGVDIDPCFTWSSKVDSSVDLPQVVAHLLESAL